VAETTKGGTLVCSECKHILASNSIYACTECGKQNLCPDCVYEVDDRFLCKYCLKNNKLDCLGCGKPVVYTCAVCGERRCKQHGHIFKIEITEYSRVMDLKTGKFYTLYCPNAKLKFAKNATAKKRGSS
jgi:hypothetical protein